MSYIAPRVHMANNDIDQIIEYFSHTAFITEDCEQGQEDLNQVVHKIQLFGASLYKLISVIFDKLTKLVYSLSQQYASLLSIWNNQLYQKLNQLDNEKFGMSIVKVVPYDTLLDYIEVINSIHDIFSNLQQTCEQPIKGNDWKTPSLEKASKLLEKIGFNLTQYNLTKQASSAYKQNKVKQPLGQSGYAISNLSDIISHISPLSKYAQKTFIAKLTKDTIKYSEQLENNKQIIKNQSDDDKEQKLQEINIKITRLWWASQFIKVAYLVTNDIITDVIKVCKVATQSFMREN